MSKCASKPTFWAHQVWSKPCNPRRPHRWWRAHLLSSSPRVLAQLPEPLVFAITSCLGLTSVSCLTLIWRNLRRPDASSVLDEYSQQHKLVLSPACSFSIALDIDGRTKFAFNAPYESADSEHHAACPDAWQLEATFWNEHGDVEVA